MLSDTEARLVLQQAELLVPAAEVQAAVARLAREINAAMSGMKPLVLPVMGGAAVFAGQLLPLLDFPLDFDYLHVSRYGMGTRGGELHWKVEPHEKVQGRAVLVLDDILDEGGTLAEVKRHLLELGAASFHCAVFAEKMHGRPKPIRADFVGLKLPDRFVFGFGMDVQGAWRNLPAVYAMKD